MPVQGTAETRGGARARRPPPGAEGARRAALWVLLVGLPLAYGLSNRLPGPHAFYAGNPGYWFAGMQVRLLVLAAGAATIALTLWRTGEGLSAVGWPARPRAWQIAVVGATLIGALALALYYHPPVVSTLVYGVTASTPVTRVERLLLLAAAVVGAAVEETVWRGAVLAWLRPVLGTFGAAALSVASYLFFHPGFGWTWAVLLLRLPLAVGYTLIALWRKSVVPSTYLHFLILAGQLLAPVAH